MEGDEDGGGDKFPVLSSSPLPCPPLPSLPLLHTHGGRSSDGEKKRKEILILLQVGRTDSSLFLPLGVVDLARRSLFLLLKKPPVVYKQERIRTIGVMSTVASRYRAKMGA